MSAEYALPIGYQSVMCEVTNSHGKDQAQIYLPLEGISIPIQHMTLERRCMDVVPTSKRNNDAIIT